MTDPAPFPDFILARLFSPDPQTRAHGVELVRRFPARLPTLRPVLVARLNDDPADRLRPALLLRELYGDSGPLLRVVVEALRSAAPDDDVRDAVLELPTLGAPKLLLECAFDRPALFGRMVEQSPRWVTRLLISEGRPGILTLRLFVAELPDPLLRQVAAVVADEALSSPHDLSPLVRPLSAVRLRPNARFEIGVALWRLTWAVDPDFVTYLLESRAGWYQPQLLASATLDLLAAEPKLDEMVSRLLEPNSSVTRARPWVAAIVRRVLGLGARGVKLLLAIDPHHHDGYLPFRAELLAVVAESEELCRAFLPVALRVVESPSLHIPGNDAPDAVRAACRIVATLGPLAGAKAVTDLLRMADGTSDFSDEIQAAVLAATAASARPAVVESLLLSLRTWHQDKDAHSFGTTSYHRFGAHARLLTALDPAAVARRLLADGDMGFACRVTARVGSACSVTHQRRWAEALMPYLADRAHRGTAPLLLGHTLLEAEVVAEVWPWLVAAVAVPLENENLITLFGYLASAREAVAAELTPLTADPHPVIAANAADALAVLNEAT